MSEINKTGIVKLKKQAFTYSVGGNVFTDDITNTDYSNMPVSVGKYNIIPDGVTNNRPKDIRDLFDKNSMASGLIGRKTNINWGQGPYLYKRELVEKKWIKTPISDPEIEDWLNKWEERGAKESFEKYLLAQMVDYNSRELHFSKVVRARGARIGMPSIAYLEHIGVEHARFEHPGTDIELTPKRIIVTDFLNEVYDTVRVYNIFQSFDPYKYASCIAFSQFKSFGRQFVNMPSWYAAKKWILLASNMPEILTYYTNNSMSPKFHVIIPEAYVDGLEETIRENCRLTGKIYTNQLLEDALDESLQQLSNVMAGQTNVGKFFASRKFKDQFGEYKWEILPIDQKIKEFIDSHLEIFKVSQFANTNAFQVPTALSNISTDGNLSSGSEILYSLKLYLATSIDLPEMIVCEHINQAIKINFPRVIKDKIQLGFYHDIVGKEEDVNPSSRMTKKV